jgi:hypothetical protein
MSGNPFQGGSPNPFAEQINPYAAPKTAFPAAPQVPSALPPFAGLWRQGGLLVMHKRAPLPDICVKSNQPATRRITRNLQWHHPAIALTILLGLLVYVVLAIVLTKRATITVPLSEEWFARRRQRILIAWVVGLVSLGLLFGGIALGVSTEHGEYFLLFVAGIFVGLGALIYGQYGAAMVRPTRMTDDYIWLKGVHPDYLNRLENWAWNI